MDSESWYSVTPESISQHIAQHCFKVFLSINAKMERLAYKKARYEESVIALEKSESRPAIMNIYSDEILVNKVKVEDVARRKKKFKIGLMLDLFCGCGGNTIPLADVCGAVVAVDIVPERLLDAR